MEERNDNLVEEEEVENKEEQIEPQVSWKPKTSLGRGVLEGKYRDMAEILEKGEKILEPEITDYLLPDLKNEFILIGGTPGKGGGIRRRSTRVTARMHKSGRRFRVSALALVGNGDGIVGIGKAKSIEHRIAMEKAMKQAKMNLLLVKRGCGSWECRCGGNHSIPYKTEGKCGSVRVIMEPAPMGLGLVAGDEVKKILSLAGIKDVIVKVFGQTGTRVNLAYAVFDALKNLNARKGEY